MTGALIRLDLFFKLTNLYKQQTDALRILHGFTESVIQERRQKLVTHWNEVSRVTDQDNSKAKTFLDILLEGSDFGGKPLSNLDIREEVDTFMFEVRYQFIIRLKIQTI